MTMTLVIATNAERAKLVGVLHANLKQKARKDLKAEQVAAKANEKREKAETKTKNTEDEGSNAHDEEGHPELAVPTTNLVDWNSITTIAEEILYNNEP